MLPNGSTFRYIRLDYIDTFHDMTALKEPFHQGGTLFAFPVHEGEKAVNNREAHLAFESVITKQLDFDLDLAVGRAHAILCATETEHHPVNNEFVSSLKKIVASCLDKLSPHKAITIFERLLHLFENSAGLNAPQVAALLYALGEIYIAQRISPFDETALDHFRPALLAFKRALALVETGGSDVFPYPTTNLLYQRLQEVSDVSFQGNRQTAPKTENLIELFRLAKSYLSQGTVGDAEWLLKRIIVLAINKSQSQILLLASCYHLLAQMHSSRHRYFEAERIYAHCWQLLEGAPRSSTVSPVDLDEDEATPLDEVMADWARLYEQMGVNRKARACWRRAILAARARGALSTVSTIRCYLSLARNYSAEGRYEESLSQYERAAEAMFGLGVFLDKGRLVYISPVSRRVAAKVVVALATDLFIELAHCHSKLSSHDLALETISALIPFLHEEDSSGHYINALFSGVILACRAEARNEALRYLNQCHSHRWDLHHEKACLTGHSLVIARLLEPARAVYLRVAANCRLDDSRIDCSSTLSQIESFIGLAKISASNKERREAILFARQAEGILAALPKGAGFELQKEVSSLLKNLL